MGMECPLLVDGFYRIINPDRARAASMQPLFGGCLRVCVSVNGVRSVQLEEKCDSVSDSFDGNDSEISEMFFQLKSELYAYAAGTLRQFSIPLDVDFLAAWHKPRGEYWRALYTIPYGKVVTYGELATLARRKPSAARAAGQACATNPCLILIPCHRVIASGMGAVEFRLGGFGGGLALKKRLLEHEKQWTHRGE